jgi:hypothetical protein
VIYKKVPYYHFKSTKLQLLFIRFNTDDASTEFLRVENYPVISGAAMDYTSAVYVDKLNRIYLFGGRIFANDLYYYLDAIQYIDLAPVTLPPEPAFNCSNRPQGSYPHPTNCSSFYICMDCELAGDFSCPVPLLFDPIQQTCEIQEKVLCFFTCEGKKGLFPHPNDCSKFLGCHDASPNVEVFDCPEPLLFDPVLLKCNLPQFVDCSAD